MQTNNYTNLKRAHNNYVINLKLINKYKKQTIQAN